MTTHRKSIDDWFEAYAQSHRNPTNKRIHWICVPLIMMSLLGMLWAVELPWGPPWLNLATIGAVFALAWYVRLSPRLAIGMVLVTAMMFGALALLAALPWPLWASCAAVFVLAWVGQFVGHQIEGHKPSFFQDLAFLLVGPVWLLGFVYERLGLRT